MHRICRLINAIAINWMVDLGVLQENFPKRQLPSCSNRIRMKRRDGYMYLESHIIASRMSRWAAVWNPEKSEFVKMAWEFFFRQVGSTCLQR